MKAKKLPETEQFYRLTLKDAIDKYKNGDITAKGLIHFYILIKLKKGWKLRLHHEKIGKELGIQKTAFYNAITRLKAEGIIDWESPRGILISLVRDKGISSANAEEEFSNAEEEFSNAEEEFSNAEEEFSNAEEESPESIHNKTSIDLSDSLLDSLSDSLSEPATPPTPPQPTAESEKSASLQKQPTANSEENQKSSPPKPVVKSTSSSESKLAVEENQHSRCSTNEVDSATSNTFEVDNNTEVKAAKIFAAEIGHEELKKFSDEQFIAWQKHCQELAKELSFEIVFLSKTVKANFSAFWNPWVEKIKHQQEQMEFWKNARVETAEERQAYNARRKKEIEECAKRIPLKQRIRQQQQN